MAMLESFLPQTNTFIVTNDEIGFSLKELSAITWLPILGKLYEEFVPNDSVLEEQFEEFRLLYFQLVAFYYPVVPYRLRLSEIDSRYNRNNVKNVSSKHPHI